MNWKFQYFKDGNADLHIHHNPYQNPVFFFVEIDMLILKFIWKYKGLIQNNLQKRTKLEDSHFPISTFHVKPQ